MYMRLVQARYKPDFLPKIQKIFDDKIIPGLRKTEGCLCVCAIKSEIQKDEGISMTLWDSKEHAEAYEKSGLYQEFLEDIKPFLYDSSEWKIRLSKDLELEYLPIQEEPIIKSYTSASQEKKIPVQDQTHFMHVRIVSLKLKPGKMDEFKRIYREEILPTVLSVKGCLYAYMTESLEEEDSALSITIWRSREDAEAYEQSGLFDQLKDKSKHTFSDLYQWKMKLEKEYSRKAVTSEDLDVKHYSIVTGKSFK